MAERHGEFIHVVTTDDVTGYVSLGKTLSVIVVLSVAIVLTLVRIGTKR